MDSVRSTYLNFNEFRNAFAKMSTTLKIQTRTHFPRKNSFTMPIQKCIFLKYNILVKCMDGLVGPMYQQ